MKNDEIGVYISKYVNINKKLSREIKLLPNFIINLFLIKYSYKIYSIEEIYIKFNYKL